MRIAHIITRLIVGGAQENTITSVLGLARRPEVEITLISGPTTGPEGSLEHLVARVPGILQIVPNLVRPVHPLKDWLALRQLTAVLLRQRPDIVHTHSGKAGVLGRIAAHRARVPVIIHTIHGPSFGAFQGKLANRTFAAAEKYAARFTTHFVVVADAMRAQYLAAGIGRPELYTKILSGFDLEPFLAARNDGALRAKLGLAASDIVIGKIARLAKLKGHDDLFSIAADLVRSNPRIKFLLVGDGDLRPKFEHLAASPPLAGHFVFAGLVPPHEVAAHIGVMDVVTHLSVREGLPRALPQALAAGKPVIACDCDGAKEVCFPGKTGFLVPAGDTLSLKRGLLELAVNEELRNRLGSTGRDFVRERFSSASMVEALDGLYRRLLNSEGIPGARPRAARSMAVFC